MTPEFSSTADAIFESLVMHGDQGAGKAASDKAMLVDKTIRDRGIPVLDRSLFPKRTPRSIVSSTESALRYMMRLITAAPALVPAMDASLVIDLQDGIEHRRVLAFRPCTRP